MACCPSPALMTAGPWRFRPAPCCPKPRGGLDIQASMMMTSRREDSMTRLLTRIRGEFLEMPGLRLTSVQAARLWALDRRTSERILDGLTTSGVLFRSREGAYLLASD